MALKSSIEYSLGKYRIVINLWLLVVFLLLQTLLNELGFWQLQRAKEKQALLLKLEQGNLSRLTSLSDISSREIAQFQAVELEVETLLEPVFLLENQLNNKQHGYHVFNLVEEKTSQKILLVNRGWIAMQGNRDETPSIDWPATNWKVSGRLYPIAEKVPFSENSAVEKLPAMIRAPLLDQVILEELEKLYGRQLQTYLLRLDANNDAAFDTNWLWINMPPEKHLAYAFQWFALALALLILGLIVAIKKQQA